MSFDRFVKDSGLKVLALAKLSSSEYSIVVYLLNCSASGIEQLITTDDDLSHLLGHDVKEIQKSLLALAQRNIIKQSFSDVSNTPNKDPMRLALNTEHRRWALELSKEASSNDAIVYPFIRRPAKFQVIEGKKAAGEKNSESEISTWKRVVHLFIQGKSLDEDELMQAEESAKILVDTHPVDQILLFIHYFKTRIPTLSLLASSWQHFEEIYEAETQKVDIFDARQKHIEMDKKLREAATKFLETKKELEPDEKSVLEILIHHRHPRRQLFWAYQLKSRYPKLDAFFSEHGYLMLPVTSSGTVVKRPQDS